MPVKKVKDWTIVIKQWNVKKLKYNHEEKKVHETDIEKYFQNDIHVKSVHVYAYAKRLVIYVDKVK